jgi:8-oxo-dGTP diphosphatase
MESRIIKDKIKDLVSSINPYDELEKNHIENICEWISSGENVFRIEKDAIPPKHIVSYTLIIDPSREKVLLFDHKKSQLMLPSGGHVEINEMPLLAAKRELKEELGLNLEIYSLDNKRTEVPFFVTVTQTVGINQPHTDVSLWYLFKEDSTKFIRLDGNEYHKEFDNFHWLSFDEILSSPIEKFDPHMHRLIQKIRKF